MQSPPKILHVVISMTVGGAERLVYDMVRHPLFAAQKPAICCLDHIGELGEKIRDEGFSVFVKQRKSGLDWSIITWLKQIIRSEGVQVVHAHQYTPLFYTTIAAKLAGNVKVVYTEHGRFYPDRKSWKRALINPILARGVDHLVSISAATARAMATYDKLPLKRIQVIHNGIDCKRMNPEFDQQKKRRELNIPDDCFVLGTAARLNSIKNIPMMIRGLKVLLQSIPNLCLVIAGQGEEEQNLKKMAIKLNVEQHVNFIGLRFDLAEIYPLFDVFLLTSYSEGISVTLLEAMACGIPSVVTDVGGNPEVVVDGKTGYLVPVNDDELLAHKIEQIIRDGSLARQLGESAKIRAHIDFSVERMIKSYDQLYR